MQCQDPLDKFFEVNAAYQDARLKADEIRATRDAIVLDAHNGGRTIRAIADFTGLSPGRVQQIIDRARSADG